MRVELFGTGAGKGSAILLDRKLSLDYGSKRQQLNKLYPMPPRVDDAVITHAHYDHCGALSFKSPKQVYSSSITKELCRLRIKKFSRLNWETIGYGEDFRVNGSSLKLLPAGHCPGSAMVEVDDGVLAYTGDLGLRNRGLWEGAKPEFSENPDLLIMDSAGASTERYRSFDDTIRDLEYLVDRALENDDRIVMLSDRLYSFETLYHLDQALNGREDIYIDKSLEEYIGLGYSSHGLKKVRTKYFRDFDDETRASIIPNNYQGLNKLHAVKREKGVRVFVPYSWRPRDRVLKKMVRSCNKPFKERGEDEFMGFLHQLNWEVHPCANSIADFVREVNPDELLLIHGHHPSMQGLADRLGDEGFEASVGLNGQRIKL